MINLIKNAELSFKVVRLEALDEKWRTSRFLKQLSSIPTARLYYPLEGEGFASFGDVHLHLRPGYIYLIPPFVATDVCCPNRLVKYWIHFNAWMSGTTLDVFNIGKCANELPVLDPPAVKAAFDQLIRIQNSPSRLSRRLDELEQLAATAAMTSLLLPFYRSMIQTTAAATPDPRLLQVLLHIERHWDRAFELTELAELVHLTPTYLSNLFNAKLGIPLIRYCNSRRVAIATRLLQESDISVKEISARLGAEDPLVFSRLFKRHTGETPQAFRRRVRGADGGE